MLENRNPKHMIHQKLLIAALAAASVIVPVATSHAQHLSIEVGDHGYYNHGPFYYAGEYAAGIGSPHTSHQP